MLLFASNFPPDMVEGAWHSYNYGIYEMPMIINVCRKIIYAWNAHCIRTLVGGGFDSIVGVHTKRAYITIDACLLHEPSHN